MSVKALVVVAALAAVVWPAASLAEKVKTNQDTKVYSRAGEQAPVVLKIASGKTVTVLTRDGRWVKIRVSGRTGWVPRSKLDLPDGDDEIARNTRRRAFVDGRGTRRGFGGEAGPDDRVGADAVGEGAEDRDDRPVSRPSRDDSEDTEDRGHKKPAREKPEKVAREKPEKPEKVAREKPEKAEKPEKPSKAKPSKPEADEEVVSVEDDDDTNPDNAPVAEASAAEAPAPARPMAHVAKATRAYAKPDKTSEVAFTADPQTPLFVGKTKGDYTKVSTDDGDAGYVLTSKLDIEGGDDASEPGGRHRLLDARGRLGINLVKQSVSTPGGANNVPDNYAASSSSFMVALGGMALYPYKEKFWYGGELTYDYNKAIPGISYMNSTTGFTYHVLNLRAIGGYDLQTKNAMTIYARFGLHYDSFQVDDVSDFTKNTAKLPNQIIAAPMIGAALGIAKLTPKLGLIASLDIIPLGSVSQTKNLEDGTSPSVKGFFLGGRLVYRWKPKMDLQFTYDMTYESLSYGGMPPAGSQRGHAGTGASKGSDFNNAISGGLSYAF